MTTNVPDEKCKSRIFRDAIAEEVFDLIVRGYAVYLYEGNNGTTFNISIRGNYTRVAACSMSITYDFCNICNDPVYTVKMMFKEAKEKIKKWEEEQE